jgi:hypothetical protein
MEQLEDFYSILRYFKNYVPYWYVIKDEFDHFEATLQILYRFSGTNVRSGSDTIFTDPTRPKSSG